MKYDLWCLTLVEMKIIKSFLKHLWSSSQPELLGILPS